jgi:hypothetical protein
MNNETKKKNIEIEIEKTIEKLLKCSKSQEQNLIQKLMNLWRKRK